MENKSYVEIRDTKVMSGNYKNFSGQERGKFNPKGKRNFCIVLEDVELADAMAEDGWNVKMREPKDGEGDPLIYIQIKIGYNGRTKPRIYMVTSKGKKTELTEETVDILDSVDIRSADVAFNPSYAKPDAYWENPRGKRGITAYLNTGIFYLEPTPFEDILEEDLVDENFGEDLPFEPDI